MFVRKEEDTIMDVICNVNEATICAETVVAINKEIAESESSSISGNTSNNDIIDGPSATFIDHNSYFDCYDSHTDTPLLDRMKRAYSTLCLVRKSCEINGLKQHEMHAQLRNETMTLRPARYSDIAPYSKILFVGIMDFAKSAFDDFIQIPSENRHALVQRNFQLMQSLDGSYRALHNFPEDDTIMTSYSTYLKSESLEEFFSGCPMEFKSGDIFEHGKYERRNVGSCTKE
ncbi:hypothetical protein PRIPAC_96864 [Pristionchus pacificus]|uniref:Uncharacterized protein n=1 Tax=Pristionchus pacificus TaxID=54126 RepID=A0A2A6D1Y4_PRIPA|nr:hypothetical protein PRIPAC_96864 [Pristionchus pacificus]|eukprot:PDM84492.1 hypothetical protein PRIPAC_33515 [Pristionchus pacificus]